MDPQRVLEVEAGKSSLHYWRDLWRYRELFLFLAWRDVLVRYKQTLIGVAWALLRPALSMVILAFVFGRLARLPSDGVPYPLLVLVGLLAWTFVSGTLVEAGGSLVANANMVSKIYFPRLIVPASSVLVGLVDFLVSCIVLAAVMIWYQVLPGWEIVLLPVFVMAAIAAALGAGLWTAALSVKYRDFRYIVPFVVQTALYLSPVAYSSNIVPAEYRLLYSLNPMAGIIDGFRWSLLGAGATVYWPGIAVSCLVIVVVLGSGIAYFRQAERQFADNI